MAPLDPNNTVRLKIVYQNAVAEHVAVLRCRDEADIPDLEALWQTYTGSVGQHCGFSEVTAVHTKALGSDIFLDFTGTTLIGDTFGSSPVTPETNAVAATAVGRSIAGRRARLSLFGFRDAQSAYRLTSGEDSLVAASIAALNAGDEVICAIDNQAVIWKGYVDIKPNDHWVGKARG